MVAIKVLDRVGDSSQGSSGEISISMVMWLLVEFNFLQVVGLRTSVSCWLLAGRHLWFFATWTSPHGHLPHQNLQGETDIAIVCDVITQVT